MSMGCLVNKTPRAVAADGGDVIKPLINNSMNISMSAALHSAVDKHIIK